MLIDLSQLECTPKAGVGSTPPCVGGIGFRIKIRVLILSRRAARVSVHYEARCVSEGEEIWGHGSEGQLIREEHGLVELESQGGH